ncbi:MAG: hypothetical protein FJZ89_02280 [Chloroflexi bacterium]|nr:hypothetical protein [Chloroflexota bacterium]
MKAYRNVLLILATLILALALSLVALAEPPAPDTTGVTLAGTVASKISYQGRLTDTGGNPLNGSYNLLFQLWDDATAGSQVGGNIVRNGVPVSNGLFTVDLDVPQSAFNGQALWLRIQVGGQWLSPRQELLPVPYALSLRPGARIDGNTTGAVVTVTNQALDLALYAQGAAMGVRGVGMTGVSGYGQVGVGGEGLTGVSGSGSWVGVYGYTEGSDATGVLGTATNYGGRGVQGNAQFGTGVVGNGEIGVKGIGSVGIGVWGEGPGAGVYGVSQTGDGVFGQTQGDWEAAAIRGVALGNAHGGYFTSTNGTGVIAFGYEGLHAEATSNMGYGVHGMGVQGAGVHGDSTQGYGVSGSGQLGGVFGTSTSWGSGVEGRVESGTGVLGVSTSGEGVVGNSVSGVAVYANTGYGEAAVKGEGPKGVYGKSSAAGGEGVLGEGLGQFTEGVLGSSAYAHGVGGYSSGTAGGLAIGVYGQTNATWGLATNQRVYAGGGCTGCTVAFIGQNGDDSPLQVGDVVAISGIAPPLQGQQTPVLVVRRATASGGGALGVVQARAMVTATPTRALSGDSAAMDTVEMPGLAPGNVAPGDYLFVVVQGLVQVRADADLGAIAVGDALGPGATAGRAQKLRQDTMESPLLGRALEPLAEGTGLIWVLVLGR